VAVNTFHLDTVYNVIRFNSRRWCSGDTTEEECAEQREKERERERESERQRERGKRNEQRVREWARKKREPFLSLISTRTRAIYIYIYINIYIYIYRYIHIHTRTETRAFTYLRIYWTCLTTTVLFLDDKYYMSSKG